MGGLAKSLEAFRRVWKHCARHGFTRRPSHPPAPIKRTKSKHPPTKSLWYFEWECWVTQICFTRVGKRSHRIGGRYPPQPCFWNALAIFSLCLTQLTFLRCLSSRVDSEGWDGDIDIQTATMVFCYHGAPTVNLRPGIGILWSLSVSSMGK